MLTPKAPGATGGLPASANHQPPQDAVPMALHRHNKTTKPSSPQYPPLKLTSHPKLITTQPLRRSKQTTLRTRIRIQNQITHRSHLPRILDRRQRQIPNPIMLRHRRIHLTDHNRVTNTTNTTAIHHTIPPRLKRPQHTTITNPLITKQPINPHQPSQRLRTNTPRIRQLPNRLRPRTTLLQQQTLTQPNPRNQHRPRPTHRQPGNLNRHRPTPERRLTTKPLTDLCIEQPRNLETIAHILITVRHTPAKKLAQRTARGQHTTPVVRHRISERKIKPHKHRPPAHLCEPVRKTTNQPTTRAVVRRRRPILARNTNRHPQRVTPRPNRTNTARRRPVHNRARRKKRHTPAGHSQLSMVQTGQRNTADHTSIVAGFSR